MPLVSIWAKDNKELWTTPAKKEQYIKCHEWYASFHCSTMFSNCTAEYMDKKPAPVCREVCEEARRECVHQGINFLPFALSCNWYPSKSDGWRKCTHIPVAPAYLNQIAGASVILKGAFTTALGLSGLTTAFLILL